MKLIQVAEKWKPPHFASDIFPFDHQFFKQGWDCLPLWTEFCVFDFFK